MTKHRAPLSNRQLGESLNRELPNNGVSALDDAEALYDLGRLHQGRGDLPNAISCYLQAIAIQPSCFEFHFNLAAALFASGQLAESAESYRQAALLRPKDSDAHYSLGVVLQRMGDAVPASGAYERALNITPEFPEALSNLGYLRLCTGDLPAAEPLLRRCIELDRGNVNAHGSLGNLLAKQGNTAAAFESFRAALTLDPNHALTLCDLGALWLHVGDLQKAELVLRRSVALDPGNITALSSLANVLAKQGKAAEAVEATRNALAIDPTHALTLCNFGVLLDGLGNTGGAVQCYELALASHPDFKLAQYNISIQHLGSGDFAAGWREYEARWETPEFLAANSRPTLAQSQWRGEDIRGSRILLYSEQGLGDTLHFVRYASMVAGLGATVVLRVQPPLVRLLSPVNEAIKVASIDSDEGANFEWQCSLMSLPLAFRTDLATIPANVPYLRADPIAADAWAHRLKSYGLRVGLVWAGNPKHARDRQRSVSLQQLASVTRVQGATFYSLQKGPAAEEVASIQDGSRIVDLSEHLEDFTDTAGILANLDLLITVDTSVAHLAGAMGKPVWVLVPRVSDWRWLHDRTDSPWYPTMRLFRQSAVGKWEDVLEQIEQELQAMLGTQLTDPAFPLPERCSVALVT